MSYPKKKECSLHMTPNKNIKKSHRQSPQSGFLFCLEYTKGVCSVCVVWFFCILYFVWFFCLLQQQCVEQSRGERRHGVCVTCSVCPGRRPPFPPASSCSSPWTPAARLQHKGTPHGLERGHKHTKQVRVRDVQGKGVTKFFSKSYVRSMIN